jgi:hypothetical protein
MIGPAGVMKVFAGAEAPSCEDDDPPFELMEIELGRRPFRPATGGSMMLTEPWIGAAHAPGKARSFRLYNHDGGCILSGTISKVDEGGDLEVGGVNFEKGSMMSVGTFTFKEYA